MARIASKAKAGFYPTPCSVAQILASKLHFEPGARLLDPCCGEGKTVSSIAADSPAETYGIELDYDKAKEAERRLHTVRWADALTEMRMTREAFGMLFLNPPYDHEENPDGKSERLEKVFLKRFCGSLQRDGWLFLVIPCHVLRNCADILARNYADIEVYAFPQPEFRTFKQCIAVGRRNPVKQEEKKYSHDYLNHLGSLLPETFWETAPALEQMSALTIPAPRCDLITFQSSRLDPEEAISLSKKAGLLLQVLQETTARRQNIVRPLAPLENGHLSLLLAGGYMNGLLEKDGKKLIIKGFVEKNERFIEAASSEDKAVYRDVYTPTVKAIDLMAGKMCHIE